MQTVYLRLRSPLYHQDSLQFCNSLPNRFHKDCKSSKFRFQNSTGDCHAATDTSQGEYRHEEVAKFWRCMKVRLNGLWCISALTIRNKEATNAYEFGGGGGVGEVRMRSDSFYSGWCARNTTVKKIQRTLQMSHAQTTYYKIDLVKP